MAAGAGWRGRRERWVGRGVEEETEVDRATSLVNFMPASKWKVLKMATDIITTTIVE